MKIVVGLGNPGSEYLFTRHNVGFLAIDAYLSTCMSVTKHKKFDSDLYTVKQFNSQIIFVKPQTYMNRSGEAVQKILSYYKLNLSDVIVIVDDFEIDFGKARIKTDGSAGTHNGLKSIVQCCGGTDFTRVRVGVGPLNPFLSVSEFVLQRFSDEQQSSFEVLFGHCNSIIEGLVTAKVIETMNAYNNRLLI
jgi:PTH1 family peptidyl-tRNA hydrolase